MASRTFDSAMFCVPQAERGFIVGVRGAATEYSITGNSPDRRIHGAAADGCLSSRGRRRG